MKATWNGLAGANLFRRQRIVVIAAQGSDEALAEALASDRVIAGLQDGRAEPAGNGVVADRVDRVGSCVD